KDSPYNRDTFVSEIDNIPKYSGIPESRGKNAYHYSIGLMDSASGQSLMKKWEKDAIQTQGVWPNYQAGSIHSLMAQVYGDQLNANIKACLFSSGLHVP